MMTWDQLSPEQQGILAKEQEALELKALDMGIARYRTERLGSERSCGSPEQKRITVAMRSLVPAIYELQKHVAGGGSAQGVTHWGYPFLSLPADKLAFITLATMVDNAGATTAVLSHRIGWRVKTERELAVIRRDAPDVYKAVRWHNKNWTKRAHRMAKARAKDVDYDWTPRTTHWMGMVLIQMAIDHAGMFDLRRFQRDGKTTVQAHLKAEIMAEIEEAHHESELLRPFYLPTVVPPKPWTNPESGGYYYHQMPLVKGHGSFRSSKVTAETHIPSVLEAVNAIQDTEWRVNDRIHEVMDQLWKAGGGWAALPPAEPLEIPSPDFEWDEADEDQKQGWKVSAAKVYDQNARLGSKRKSVIHKLWIAAQLSGKGIYFPHQLDWRGRGYPTPSHLHPQSDDAGRSLLEFADRCELGDRGREWLAIHLANCFGRKGPYAERIAWTRANMTDIEQSAKNPIDHRWWSMAKKPWQTLAACFEMVEAGKPGSKSCLPVQVDGSCNGLQHFSAMGRDLWGGLLVNLLPSDMPRSVYVEVAKEVVKLITADAADPGVWREAKGERPALAKAKMARRWEGRVTADTVKRPTMTIVYGLTYGGMMKQYLEDKWAEGVPGEAVDNIAYLRDKTWEALEGTLRGASTIMGWLRDVALIASENNRAIRWETPIGFPVVQEYLENRSAYLYTALQRLTIRLPNSTRRISAARQIRGLPPNFVHSFDASHMMATVLNCKRRGIRSFSMIHDSFGVHAARVDDLQAAIREEFVRMYEGPVLRDLWERWEADLGVMLPDPPDPGGLDLGNIIQSQYMFG